MRIPSDLIERRQWLLWRDEHGTKVPYQVNGRRGKSNDPNTWSSYDECLSSRVDKSGIAFVFSSDDPFCGVDLDDCIIDGIYEPWAQEIIDQLEGLAYCEISPSGSGVKLITRAKKPEGSSCSNARGVECYDDKRFWTITGNCIGDSYASIGDGQAAIDWLIEKHLKGSERKTTGKRLEQPIQPAPLSLIVRAKAYADNVPGAAKGNLRNSAFKLAGHLHSLSGEMGEHLGDSEVYELLVGWNCRNLDQLREDELREAAVNGRKNGSPPADKPPEVRIKYDEVDLSEFVIPCACEPIVEFPAECLRPDGILAEVVDYTLARSMYPQPELALAGALALLATVTGRKIQSDYGTRTNCYFLGLAPSGAGKEQARKSNKEILTLSGAGHLLGPERIASSAGLTSFVKQQLSPLFQLDEVGRLLATMKNASKSPHLFNIGTVLMQLYSSSDQTWIGDAYADVKKTPTIEQPHCVVYGTAVPDGFWDGMTRESISDGLLGRMMIFESPGYVGKNRPKLIYPTSELVQSIRWWVDFQPGGNMAKEHPQPITCNHHQNALDRYESHLDAIDSKKATDGSEGAALWSRAGEKVAKLSMLFAISRQRETEQIEIGINDVNLAIKLSNWLTRRMLQKAGLHLAANETEASRKRILRVLEEAKGRVTLSELTRKTQWLKRRERAEYLDELRESGQIEIVIEATQTKPVMWVVLQK